MTNRTALRFYGLKLFQIHLAKVGSGLQYLRAMDINRLRVVDRCCGGLRIYKNPLWLCMMEAKLGKRIVKNRQEFKYISFTFYPKTRFYRFLESVNEDGKQTWSLHSF